MRLLHICSKSISTKLIDIYVKKKVNWYINYVIFKIIMQTVMKL